MEMELINQVVNFQEVCRVCLQISEDMKSFLSNSQDVIDILDKYSSLNNFQVRIFLNCLELNYGTPSKICNKCEEKLIQSFNFKQQCIESEERIKNYLIVQRMKVEPDSDNSKSADDPSSCKRGSKDKKGITNISTLSRIKSCCKEKNDFHSISKDALYCNESKTKVDQKEKEVQKWVPSPVEEIKKTEPVREFSPPVMCSSSCISNHQGSKQTNTSCTHTSHTHRDKLETNHPCSVCNELVSINCEESTNTKSFSDIICKVCNKEASRKRFPSHFKRTVIREEIKCHICGKIFFEKSKLSIHLRRSKCKVTGNNIKQESDTYRGAKKKKKSDQTDTEIYECHTCGRDFASKRTLVQHLSQHSGNGHKCSYCNKVWRYESELIDHLRVHTGERPFICNVCGNGFKTSGALGNHIKLHQEKDISCNLCDKKFSRQSSLKLHMKNHTGEKPYLCSKCGKGFTCSSLLNVHVKVHSDQLPYKCDQCGRGFRQRGNLRSHELIHTGIKKLKCPNCAYACNKKYHLNQHMKRHGDLVEEHVCLICKGSFTTKVSLQMHMTSVHNAIL